MSTTIASSNTPAADAHGWRRTAASAGALRASVTRDPAGKADVDPYAWLRPSPVLQPPSAGGGKATVKPVVRSSSAHGGTAGNRPNVYHSALRNGATMIVSHRHRFVFVAIPKTGTHSVRMALREHLAPDDIEQVGLFVDKRFPYPELAKLQHGHLGLAQLRPHLGEDAFAAYFKFAFVRNPFDRFVSYCAFVTRETDSFQRDPRAVMRHVLFERRPLQHVLYQPQHAQLVDENGALLSDYVGRVEQMQQSYDEVCARVGIPTTPLEQVNSTRRGHYRDYYDQQLVDGVAALYRRDLELFGYGF
jgi:hypothetical protein